MKKADYDVREILEFLKDLTANNNREWFAANKNRYLRVKDEVETLTQSLLNRISEFDESATRLTPSDCLYRIYRDTRFSADKTPYKNHIGIYINPPYGKKAPGAGYYLHLEPGNSLVAGGLWCPEAPVLKRVRQDIYENVEEYLEIIEDPTFSKYFERVGEDLLKTAPKGYPKDWEHIELLRPRNFTAYSPLTERTVCSARMEDEVIERMKALRAFNSFLNFAIDPNREE